MLLDHEADEDVESVLDDSGDDAIDENWLHNLAEDGA